MLTMRRRKSQAQEFKGFLDHGTSLTGELQFSGTLRIDGNVHGSITTDDLLIIGEKAVVHADIKAGEVQIFGSVYGNVESERRIDVHASGSLHGDVRTPQLVIEEGGTFEGRSRSGSSADGEDAAEDADELARRKAASTS
jgi:cytoskeletal protein CcmA (bactofilin family)